jgi:hypothetical protein
MLISNNQKEFELPNNGTYTGTIVDVVDLGEVLDPRFGKKYKLRVIWLLNKNDSEGRPFQVMQQVNAVMADKPKESGLYKLVRSVLGTAPTIPYETEGLIGRSNEMFIVQEVGQSGKKYANIKAILPLTASSKPTSLAANYVRQKDKAAKQSQTNSTITSQPAVTLVSSAVPQTEAEIPF